MAALCSGPQTIEKFSQLPAFQPQAKSGYAKTGRIKALRKLREDLIKQGIDPIEAEDIIYKVRIGVKKTFSDPPFMNPPER